MNQHNTLTLAACYYSLLHHPLRVEFLLLRYGRPQETNSCLQAPHAAQSPWQTCFEAGCVSSLCATNVTPYRMPQLWHLSRARGDRCVGQNGQKRAKEERERATEAERSKQWCVVGVTQPVPHDLVGLRVARCVLQGCFDFRLLFLYLFP